MVRTTALGLAIASSLVLAGCLGGEDHVSVSGLTPRPGAVDEATASDQAGPTTTSGPMAAGQGAARIEGTVTDDELRPVANVSVSLVGMSRHADTSADGDFLFTNLAPGAYTLMFEHPEYQVAGRNVDLDAGETRTLDVRLERVSFDEARHETLVFEGYIPVGESFVDILFCQEMGGKCTFQFNANASLAAVVNEADFTPTIPGHPVNGNRLYFQLRHQDVGGSLYGDGYFTPRAKHVIAADWDRDKDVAFFEMVTCDIYWVCYEQRFTNVLTLFYLDGPPDGFSALPPG